MSKIRLVEIQLNSAIKYSTSNGLVNNFPITFDYVEEDYLQVFIGFKEVVEFNVVTHNGLPCIQFPKDVPADTYVVIRRVTPSGVVPHTYQYIGNAQGGAEFNAKTIDENFQYLSDIVSEVEDFNKISQDGLKEIEDEFKATQELAEEAVNTANKADKKADQAIKDAEEALRNSMDALEISNQASDNSNEALKIAEQAKDTANKSKDIAEEAIRISNDAKEIANKSEDKAEDAMKIAEGAETKAKQAVDIANNALEVALSIDAKAQEALDKSKEADVKADTALSTSNNAVEIAEGIEGVANDAKNIAEEAKKIAEDALGATTGDFVVQETGQSEVKVMSQKAVTDCLGLKADLTYVDEALEGLDLSDYATTEYVDNKTRDLASEKFVEDSINSIGIDNYRTLDNNEFHGLLSIKSDNDNIGVGVFLQESDGTVRGQMVSNSYGLQFAQVQEDGTSQTFTFPRYGNGGEILIDSSIGLDKFSITKEDIYTPVFEKVAPDTIRFKPGVKANTPGSSHNLSGRTIKMANKIPGSDYVVIVDTEGNTTIKLDNFESPVSLKSNEFIIGGFYYSLIPEDETVSSGAFATTGAGMIWTQEDVNKIRGINEYSFWDIRFRAGGLIASPLSPRYNQLSNHGMVFDKVTNRWFAVHHTGTNVDKYGLSRSGSDIASGTVHAIVPSAWGGNGSKKYDNMNWWTANEIATSQGARLLYEYEFNSRAWGTTENKVAGGSAVTYPKTERIKGLTSRLGCEQVTGVQWYWGLDSNYRSDGTGWSYKDVLDSRGQIYTQGTYGLVRALFGGLRTGSSSSVGSRQVGWDICPWDSHWSRGLVASRDLLIL